MQHCRGCLSLFLTIRRPSLRLASFSAFKPSKPRTIFGADVTDTRSVVKRMTDRFLISASFPDTLLKDSSPLSSIPKVVYVGFDPTAESLHIGHLLVINALLHFYAAGFDVIAVIGGATAKLGDPSGRLTERSRVDQVQIARNSTRITGQLERIFRNFGEYFLASPELLEPLKQVRFVDNSTWYKDVNVIDFLAKIGPHFRLKHMLGKETVRFRSSANEGMHFAEFSYQVFQAYDWLRLFEETGCLLQIGGSDQIGNIHSGHDLIRRLHGKDAFGLVTPLLTSAKGEKLGKSTLDEQLKAWLDENMTSPFEFYQYLLRLSDSEVAKYLHLFTFLPLDEVERISAKHDRDPEKRIGQTRLAEELTLLVHGRDHLASAQRCTDALYNGSVEKLCRLSEEEFRTTFSAVPTVDVQFRNDVTVQQVAMKLPPFAEGGERSAVETIRNGGIHINYQRIREPECVIVHGVHILPNGSSVVRVEKPDRGVIQVHSEGGPEGDSSPVPVSREVLFSPLHRSMDEEDTIPMIPKYA